MPRIESAGSVATEELRASLRLMVLTDPAPACGRPLEQVVRECVAAGATCIQLRDKEATDDELLALAQRVGAAARSAGAMFILNDRYDIALAAGADGVHLGPKDIPVAAVRKQVPPGFVIGRSTDDLEVARGAAEAGASYLGVGAVFGTLSKPGLADEALGPARVGEVLTAARLPGVGIGGITAENAAGVVAAGAGVAVMSFVMHSARPAEAVRALRAAMY